MSDFTDSGNPFHLLLLLMDPTESTQVEETQLEGGTAARVKSAAAHSQFFCKETFFESSIF